ncbi:PAF acetylhydrolase family protein [Setomelanomma holmii]|uniref:1-alkyl-2-acetylglycerophosphocholine esterase n=1 Tax=Setomelanomma holmii TaxID=210430 RepID=A0A9P4LSD2_9PLEO|nr:PAF acetylhydrolase family protein [Setomelanomma holmii]
MTYQTILLFACVALPSSLANILPIVGPQRYDVAITTASLTDSSRLDPFANDGRQRSVVISTFSPVSYCRKKEVQRYMPPATAAFQNDKFAAYGLLNGSFQSLRLETCSKSTSRGRDATLSFPLVLFSGALGTSRMLYNSMLQSIAAAGYLAVSMDHPYDADIVEYPYGTIITDADLSTDADVELTLKTRVEDFVFVHQHFTNTSVTSKQILGHGKADCKRKTALIGHSLGGATAAAAMLRIPSALVALNLDGTMFGPVLETGLDRHFMLIGHENKTQETDPSWKAIWPKLTGWKKEFEVKGAAHYSFSDLPLITSVLGLQEMLPPQAGEVLGTVEGERMMKLTVTYVTAFLDMVLKSGGHGVLDGIHGDFPEVAEVS